MRLPFFVLTLMLQSGSSLPIGNGNTNCLANRRGKETTT
ncbi:hypothetical protein NSE_0774 [Neorickettsia sennetsu str. Miyayama]|uniref:Uncharacterized protein n=1 Tax=Ehrlichia sennetsu (strain ATCC VR-367 / Miyayama) TaxID=222891 RepID=Q2GCZ7_EHRS3|nr:hypothetical protein NSE_0774 [Neorickettsia sennetsu str. Miyayama]